MLSEKHFGNHTTLYRCQDYNNDSSEPQKTQHHVACTGGGQGTLQTLKSISHWATVLNLQKKKKDTDCSSYQDPLCNRVPSLWCPRGRRKAMAVFQSPPPSLPSSSLGCQNLHLPQKQTISLGVKFAVCPLQRFLHVGCYHVQSIKLSASRLFTELLSSQSR